MGRATNTDTAELYLKIHTVAVPESMAWAIPFFSGRTAMRRGSPGCHREAGLIGFSYEIKSFMLSSPPKAMSQPIMANALMLLLSQRLEPSLKSFER
jgi:hypothetical protein